SFYTDARSRLDLQSLKRIVKSRPDATSGTALAKTIAAVGRGKIFSGRIILYEGFFSDFDIAIGSSETGTSLGIPIEERRVIVLLHELTHLTRRYIDVFQFAGINYFDEAIYDKSTINKRIYEACKTCV
ncbi:MAG: hypothetical protein HKN33_15175, partial [Pyrinomonadaceae bacterium]|nr:hypothetical protein [Pyrinomonadaceae bacterium]